MSEWHSKALRLTDLARHIEANPTTWFTTRQLAERYGVNQRTAQRDIYDIESLGLALEVDQIFPGGGGQTVKYRLFR